MIPIEKIDEFIKYYATIYHQNPQLEITDNTMYAALKNYGLSQEEINDPIIRDQIDELKANFKSAKSLQVFETDEQAHFLQFMKEHPTDPNCKVVKLYLSIPKPYISYASQRIFDYVERCRMVSYSKVAEKVRSDGIVLRLASEKDARAVLNFINSDPGLQSIARETNPFSLKEGIVGIGYDDNISYNTIVSEILSKYFNSFRNSNQLLSASRESLANFVNKFYQDTFINYSNLINLTIDIGFVKSSKKYDHVGKEILDYEQIVRLLLNICSNNLNINQYFEFFNECKDESLNSRLVAQYDDIYSQLINLQLLSQNNVDIDENLENLLEEFISYALTKYQSVDTVSNALSLFLDGNLDAITRDNNYRQRLGAQDINKLIAIVGPNVNSYVQNIANGATKRVEQPVNQYQNMDNSVSSYNEQVEVKKSPSQAYDLLCNAALDIAARIGLKQLIVALKSAELGNFSYFPNGEAIATQLNPSDIEKYCLYYLTEQGFKANDIVNPVTDFAAEIDKIATIKKNQIA